MVNFTDGITSLVWVITVGIIWIVATYWLAEFSGWIGDYIVRRCARIFRLFND
jgi:hypothetical protein